jgi:hypothetical protein
VDGYKGWEIVALLGRLWVLRRWRRQCVELHVWLNCLGVGCAVCYLYWWWMVGYAWLGGTTLTCGGGVVVWLVAWRRVYVVVWFILWTRMGVLAQRVVWWRWLWWLFLVWCVVDFFDQRWIQRLALIFCHLFFGFWENWAISCPMIRISLMIHIIQRSVLALPPTSPRLVYPPLEVIVFSSVKGSISIFRL